MKNIRPSTGFIALLIIMSLLTGILGGGLTIVLLKLNINTDSLENKAHTIEKQIYIEESKVIDAIKKISPSVVSIVSAKNLSLYNKRIFDFDNFYESPSLKYGQKIGGGSGFIVTNDGLIVTNKHVVSDLKAKYTVILNNGSEYDSEVISRDTLNDIAILQIKSKENEEITGLPVAEFGDSEKLQIGQRVIAIGNALAEYENTVTTGVVSAKGRSIMTGEINSDKNLLNLIQTDAAINPGNSGGPLINLNGQVIGINTATASQTHGISFAIPINDIAPVITSVKLHGEIIRPFLGVHFMMLSQKKADELKINKTGALLIDNQEGAKVAITPDGPAEKAGLKINDLILEVDSEKVTPKNPLNIIINKKEAGDKIKLMVWRDDEIIEIKVVLGEMK